MCCIATMDDFSDGSIVRASAAAGRGKTKNEKISRSERSGLQFPVGRVHRMLKKRRYAPRIGTAAPVYMAAVMEYLAAEILELAGNKSLDNNKKRITPRHITLAVRFDEELNKLLEYVTITEGGVIPQIHLKLTKPKLNRSDTVQRTEGMDGYNEQNED